MSVFPMTFLIVLVSGLAQAGDSERLLTIQDHRFEPAELRVPAGQKIKLVVHNLDATAEEFESHVLNREKVIPGGGKVPVHIGPLQPGRYPFVGEFHSQTAQGVIIAE